MNWHDLFRCEAGVLIHKRRAECANHAWNARYAGKPAGALRPDGYIRVRLGDAAYYAHVIVYEMTFGPVPPGFDVDHKNRIKSDNRPENLRLATRGENKINAARYKSNTSGAKGVNVTRKGKFQASIGGKGNRAYLGQYDKFEDAVAAYDRAAKERYGDFVHPKGAVA